MARVTLHLLCAAFIALAAGCSSSAPPAPAAKPSGSETGPSVASKPSRQSSKRHRKLKARDLGEELTEGKYVEFAKSLEETAYSGNADAFDSGIDYFAIATTALQDIEISADVRKKSIVNCVTGMKSNSIGKLVVNDLSKGASFVLLRVNRRDDGHYALYRFKPAMGGFNYYELSLTENAQGEVQATDIYLLTSGELVSATTRRGLIQVLAQTQKNMLQKLMQGSDRKLLDSLNKLLEMQPLLRDGKALEVLQIYDNLHPEVQKQKPAMILRLNAASVLDDTEKIRTAIAEYKQQFPGDPSIDVLSIDLLLKEQNYLETHAAIDRVDAFVGGDADLQTSHSAIYLLEGDLDKAEQASLRAIDDLRVLPDAYWQLISVNLRQQDHASTLQHLLEVERKFQLVMGDIAQVADYAEFVKRPEYQMWLQRKDPVVAPR